MSMKVNTSVEATAQEMREFLGLPNIQPLQDDVLKTLRDNVQHGVISFDSLNQFLKPLLPAQLHSIDLIQKFWEAVVKASNPINKEDDKKTGVSPEFSNVEAIRN
jgi:hypothetical protein